MENSHQGGLRGEYDMDGNAVIRQDDPNNILWQLFRIWVEETVVPNDIRKRVIQVLGANPDEH